jgi:hypothetical protein
VDEMSLQGGLGLMAFASVPITKWFCPALILCGIKPRDISNNQFK